ncbi:unnamed protein product [Lactuca saligna]|uniref:Uncharacterized protein n=1 Tax=Lactuca saligna TaxID=75948 RepID=A0AA36EN09_LACSI|nr:unnamed protein product [Lactuca saligna]
MSPSFNQNSIAPKTPTDFTFCNIPKTNYYENKIPFGFSAPLYSKNVFSDSIYQPYSTTVMTEGRKELMELMPESFHELSLKDIVMKDSDQSKKLETLKEITDHTKLDLKRKKKGTKNRPISRSVSLDTGVYILKMFVPSSLGSKKHNVSRSKSMDGLMKHSVDVRKRRTWLFVGSTKISSGLCNNNSSCTTANKNRYGDGMLKPSNGCLFRSKPTNQRGCIFF